MRREALLVRREQVDRLQTLVQRDMGALKDRPDLYRELLPAMTALLETDPGALALDLINSVHTPAMRADRPIGPQDGL